jgi:5-methylcytosine-specific restriction protein A
MPTSSLKPCSYPGCSELVKHGRCTRHQQEARAIENAERDPKVKALYNSTRWLGIRAGVLARSPWCEQCLKDGRYVQARHVDHIQPHHGNVSAFFSGPFQSLCIPCHSRKTLEEIRGRGAENVLSGELRTGGASDERKTPRSGF